MAVRARRQLSSCVERVQGECTMRNDKRHFSDRAVKFSRAVGLMRGPKQPPPQYGGLRNVGKQSLDPPGGTEHLASRMSAEWLAEARLVELKVWRSRAETDHSVDAGVPLLESAVLAGG